MSTPHEEIIAYMPVKVDKGISPLLELIWAKGYHTEWSCQGNPDSPHSAYVVFRHWRDHGTAIDFLAGIGYPGDVVVDEYKERTPGAFNPRGDVYVYYYDLDFKSSMYFNSSEIDYMLSTAYG